MSKHRIEGKSSGGSSDIEACPRRWKRKKERLKSSFEIISSLLLPYERFVA